MPLRTVHIREQVFGLLSYICVMTSEVANKNDVHKFHLGSWHARSVPPTALSSWHVCCVCNMQSRFGLLRNLSYLSGAVACSRVVQIPCAVHVVPPCHLWRCYDCGRLPSRHVGLLVMCWSILFTAPLCLAMHKLARSTTVAHLWPVVQGVWMFYSAFQAEGAFGWGFA